MKDFALAATNSIEEVWGKKNVLVGTCAYHASSRWLDTAGKSHVRTKDNLKLIMADFQFARDCPYVSLVPIVVDAMVSKWKKVYKEDALAEAWYKQWGKTVFSRIALNANNPTLSGFPCDNNTVESTNQKDKIFFDKKRTDGISFIGLLSDRIEFHSLTDTEYIGKFNQEVHNRELYLMVHKARESYKNKEPCFLNIVIPYKNDKLGIPTGSFLIPTKACMDEIHDAINREAHLQKNPPTSPQEYIKWLKKEGWVQTYKNVVQMSTKKLGTDIEKQYSCRYECMKQWLGTFHLIKPFCSKGNHRNKVYTKELLKMLDRCELNPVSYKTLTAKNQKEGGLFICNCSRFLHYGWCYHTCAFAFQNGIIKSYPSYMDPTGIIYQKKAGRPNTNKGRRALTKK